MEKQKTTDSKGCQGTPKTRQSRVSTEENNPEADFVAVTGVPAASHQRESEREVGQLGRACARRGTGLGSMTST
jgi:hypothetical protein